MQILFKYKNGETNKLLLSNTQVSLEIQHNDTGKLRGSLIINNLSTKLYLLASKQQQFNPQNIEYIIILNDKPSEADALEFIIPGAIINDYKLSMTTGLHSSTVITYSFETEVETYEQMLSTLTNSVH